MPTDTFDTPRIVFTDDAPPSRGEPDNPPTHGRSIGERLAGVSRALRQRLTMRPRRVRNPWPRLRETAAGLPSAGLGWLDSSLVAVWSLAVALVAAELALAVSPALGISLALLEGIALGASGARLYRRIARG